MPAVISQVTADEEGKGLCGIKASLHRLPDDECLQVRLFHGLGNRVLLPGLDPGSHEESRFGGSRLAGRDTAIHALSETQKNLPVANEDLALQAAFFYAWLDKVKVTGTTELPGNYQTRVWIASAGVVWRTDLGGGK